MFDNLNSAVNWVNKQKKFNKRVDLNDLKNALSLLDNPDKAFKIIHIGGTNGKGSTSVTTSNILIEAGYKVGLYVSPFVVKFNERISINHEYISDEDLLKYINFMYDFNNNFKKNHDSLSFFEIITIISFMYFKDQKIDIAVYEVGLGGRLDATNVCTPLLSSVTNIQKDHEAQLGNTYKKILNEKLGIMKYGIPFVTSIKREELMPIIKERAYLYESPLRLVRNIKNIKIDEKGTHFTYKGARYQTSLIGFHQASNASLAIEIIHTLNDYYKFNISEDVIEAALLKTKWPGRFEIIKEDIILDGGHNEEGQLALKKTITCYTSKDITIVYCAMKDKDTKSMINILDSYANKLILTEIDYSRSEKSSNLTKLSQINGKIAFDNYKDAIKYALKHKKKDEVILFTGSLYFISRVREYFTEEK